MNKKYTSDCQIMFDSLPKLSPDAFVVSADGTITLEFGEVQVSNCGQSWRFQDGFLVAPEWKYLPEYRQVKDRDPNKTRFIKHIKNDNDK